ncbi:ATP-dependent zinc metalloprotease FtsH [Desulfofustis glycolicus]
MLLFFLLWLIISYGYMAFWQDRQIEEISYSHFKTDIKEDRVASIEMTGSKVVGSYLNEGEDTGEATGEPPQRFRTVVPDIDDSGLMALLEEHGVEVTARPDEQSWLRALVITLLPWILIIGLFVYLNRRMRAQFSGSGGPFSYGKSKAKEIRSEEVDIAFADVAGLENAKNELRQMVDYLKDPQQFQEIGAELPKGVLLAGPPGTGKTLMARAVAGEAGVPFFSISGSEFVEMFVGVGASRVRDMFGKAKKNAPSLIFIDELDSIGRARGTGIGGGHDEREQTLNQILSEIDGFSPQESVIVLAATNRPDVLDPALIRPGRFDRQIHLDLPRKEARKKIIELHAGKVLLAEGVDFDLLASATVGFSGADLKNLVNEAALLAARKGKKRVDEEDFNESRDKIIMGIKREDRLSEQEREIVAYHEAGHALTALLLPKADPLAKVSIIPRGRALGATEQIPEEERHNLSRTYLLDRLTVLIGGRAAEELVFGDISSGAGDDLKNATHLARRMVCQWGMSETIGLMVFKKGEPHPFLGRELTEEKDYSEATAEKIDAEIRRLLEEAGKQAQELLEHHREQLDLLAETLISEETLSAGEVERLLDLDGLGDHFRTDAGNSEKTTHAG